MIDICAKDINGFSKYRITKAKVQNFESIKKKKKVAINGKVQEIKLQRDLFGRLLGISLSCQERMDIEKVIFKLELFFIDILACLLSSDSP